MWSKVDPSSCSILSSLFLTAMPLYEFNYLFTLLPASLLSLTSDCVPGMDSLPLKGGGVVRSVSPPRRSWLLVEIPRASWPVRV